MRIDAVIFDLDGVIVDTEGPHFRSVVQAFSSYDVHVSQSEYDEFILGKGPILGLKCYIDNVHPQLSTELDSLLRFKATAFREELERDILVFPDTFDMLEILFNNIPLGVCSSLTGEEVSFSLERTGLIKFFPTVISGDDVHVTKPNPQGFLMAAERLNIPPSTCLGIEDAVVGIEALKNAGMTSLAVTYTQSEELLKAAKPDFIIDHLMDFDWEELVETRDVTPS